MSRFRPLPDILAGSVTTCNHDVTSSNHDKSLISKGVTSVTNVTSKKRRGCNENGGVVAATKGSFRDILQRVAAGMPVDLAVLVAEFANDAEDIAEGRFTDETIRRAIQAFMQRAGIQLSADSTPEQDGMIQCKTCGHWWQRCRNPELHGGVWPVLDAEQWRRCAGYQARVGGG